MQWWSAILVCNGRPDPKEALVGSGCGTHSTRMTSVVELYEALTSAEDDRARARVIAEAFARLEDRDPHLPELATQGHLRETELRLQKEIEQVRLEIAEAKAGIIRWTVGWTGGLLLAQAGLILGGLRILFPAPG